MNSKRSDIHWRFIRCFVVVILFAAAYSKATSATQILASDGLLSSDARLLAAIAFEAAVATYLLIAPTWWSWLAAVVCFFCFTVAASYAWFIGTECNCFGDNFGVRYTLPLDILTLVVSVIFRPSANTRSQDPVGRSFLIVPLSGLAFVAFAHLDRLQDTAEAQAETIELLLADMYVDKPWPLTKALHRELDTLRTGRWLILVIREDCDHCQQLLEQYFSNPTRHRPGERTAVFVAGNDKWPFQFDTVSLSVESDNVIAWEQEPFVASPAVFVVSEGIVTDAADGTESDAFFAHVFSANTESR